MSEGSKLERAFALRDAGRFREAFDEFCNIADATDNGLTQADITLNAIDALIFLGEYSVARQRLEFVRELLLLSKQGSLTADETEKFQKLTLRVDLEDAEIDAAEGSLVQALAKMRQLVDKYREQSRRPNLREDFDCLLSQMAFVLTNTGDFLEALPILEDIASRHPLQSGVLFHLGHCYFRLKEFFKARETLEQSLRLGLPAHLDFQAHCSLGMTCYELKDYGRARLELETGAKGATGEYIRQAHIWKWLEYTCINLGLKADALHYAQMAKPA